MRKWGIAAAGLLTAAIAAVPVHAESGLDEVYHLYAGDAYLGVVTDKEKAEETVAEKLAEAEERYGELEYEVSDAYTLIPEQVFEPKSAAEETVLQELKDTVVIEARAFLLAVNGEDAMYVKDREAYEQVLRELKLAFVSEEELAAWEESQKTEEAPAELKEGETRIRSLTINEDLSGSEEVVKPSVIVSAEEAADYLLTGQRQYTAVEGDTLTSVAEAFGIDTETLVERNPDAEEFLKEGTVLDLSQEEGLVQVEVVKEQKTLESIPYWSVETEDSSLPAGETAISRKGQDGQVAVTSEIRKVNGEVKRERITDEQTVKKPVDEQVVYGTKELAADSGAEAFRVHAPDSGSFAWPAENGQVTSEMGERWGEFHRGIDIARVDGYSVKAAAEGIVVAAGWQGTYGNRVIVDHGDGYRTLYAHLSAFSVKPGDAVSQSTELGTMGTTGRSTGIHLHFEVIKDGVNIDPLEFVAP